MRYSLSCGNNATWEGRSAPLRGSSSSKLCDILICMMNSQCALARPVNAYKIFHRVLICIFYARRFASVSVFYEVFYASVSGCLAKFIYCLPQRQADNRVLVYAYASCGTSLIRELVFPFFAVARKSFRGIARKLQCMRISVGSRQSADVVIHVCGFFRCILCGETCYSGRTLRAQPQ